MVGAGGDKAPVVNAGSTPEPEDFAELFEEADKAATGGDVSLTEAGLKIVKWCLYLIVAVIIGIGGFALATFPTPDGIASLASPGTDKLDAYRQAQTLWFTQTKDLLQLLVVSLLVPLLASVIGYIFGRKAA